MIGVHGPLGFNNLDGQGLLVEGFDQLPSIASTYHLPYYQKLIEDNGYEKENDWVEFRLTIGEVPEKALKLNESIKLRYKLKLITFSDTKQLVPYAPKVFRLLNEAFAELPYVSPFSEEMITFYSNKYFKFLNPRFVKLIEDEQGNMVAFIVSVPSLSSAMQKANGSLFPFGWWHILQAFKKPEVADLFLTGIDPKMQGQGVPAVLITELQKTMLDNGVKYVETTGIFETNHKAITTWKNYEHIQHKRRRCYRKLF
jgi:GNAT superfamily N-acetyltransferase